MSSGSQRLAAIHVEACIKASQQIYDRRFDVPLYGGPPTPPDFARNNFLESGTVTVGDRSSPSRARTTIRRTRIIAIGAIYETALSVLLSISPGQE